MKSHNLISCAHLSERTLIIVCTARTVYLCKAGNSGPCTQFLVDVLSLLFGKGRGVAHRFPFGLGSSDARTGVLDQQVAFKFSDGI